MDLAADPKTPRILVVDDERGVRDLLDIILREAGFAVDLADSGDAGLRILDKNRPDLVLLDVIMPGMTAWTFIRALQERPCPPPVVIISAEHASPNALGSLAGVVRAFVPKPFTSRSLVTTCQQVLVAASRESAVDHERRAESRRQLVVNVMLLSDRGQPIASGHTQNLSRSGAQVDIGVPLLPGQAVSLALHLPDYWEPLSLAGRVVWQQGGVLGVRFIAPAPEDVRRLSTLLRPA